MSALSPRSGIQVSSVYPTYTHIKGQCPKCVCVCVCVHACVWVAKPVAVELRCHATALYYRIKFKFPTDPTDCKKPCERKVKNTFAHVCKIKFAYMQIASMCTGFSNK